MIKLYSKKQLVKFCIEEGGSDENFCDDWLLEYFKCERRLILSI